MTNKNCRVLYTGVTTDLKRRTYQHREGLFPGFTRKYSVKYLVYYETHESLEATIGREKQFKDGPRRRKVELIERFNPDWRDLYDEI